MPSTALKAMGAVFPMPISELEFKADGTYVEYDPEKDTQPRAESEKGTYTVSGNTITMTPTWWADPDDEDDQGVSTLTISGNRLTFTEEGQSLAFTKKS